MAKVRVLVGTRKGAFVMTSDERRKDWKVDGPHFAGWEVYHMNGSTPDTVYAGVEDAAFFKFTDGAKTWEELPGIRTQKSAASWAPGAGGLCLHTIILDPVKPDRIFAAISAAGAFRSDDSGKTWKPITKGLHSEIMPDPDAEAGHCVHRIAMHPSRPNALFMQK